MEFLGYGLIFFLLGFFIRIIIVKQRKMLQTNTSPKQLSATNILVPKELGIKEHTEYTSILKELYKKLISDLDSEYIKNVKKRVMVHTNWTEEEYDIYFYGMKQYLLMNAVLKSVPMFSEEVDEIWHEMLMFTKEYEDFCKNFIGETIHHAPNTSEGKNEPGVRAEFDWFYSQFFELNDAAKFIYRGFFHHKMEQDAIDSLEGLSKEQIRLLYFKENYAAEKIGHSLAKNMEKEILKAKTEREQRLRVAVERYSSKPKTKSVKKNDSDFDSIFIADTYNSNNDDSSSSSKKCGSSCSSSSCSSSCSSSSCSSCSS